jgi:hypothetical protein
VHQRLLCCWFRNRVAEVFHFCQTQSDKRADADLNWANDVGVPGACFSVTPRKVCREGRIAELLILVIAVGSSFSFLGMALHQAETHLANTSCYTAVGIEDPYPFWRPITVDAWEMGMSAGAQIQASGSNANNAS